MREVAQRTFDARRPGAPRKRALAAMVAMVMGLFSLSSGGALGALDSSGALRSEYYSVVSDQIVESLQAYERIPVSVPAPDPQGGTASAAAGQQSLLYYLRAPYFTFDDEGQARQDNNVAAAPEALREAFYDIPSAVRLGKGTPKQLQAAVETALATGLVRDPNGSWPPTPADLEQWMQGFGIGVDCSGLAYQALTRVDRALVSRGEGGLAIPLDGSPIDMSSADIAKGGDEVETPDELRSGDMMYLAPDDDHPYRHIRVLYSVSSDGQGVQFKTAESSEGDGGPATRLWRFLDSSGYANLEQFVDGEWRSADARQQRASYWRRLATP